MPVPDVLAVFDGDDGSPQRLVLEWIDQERRVSPDGEAGARSGAGSPPSRRLAVPLRLAHDRRALPASGISKLHLTIERLEEFGGSPEPPARLHGDLWAGNRMIDGAGRSWLIDPCHGGHREYDLAMMRLFGGFGRECFDGYAAEWPLADGGKAGYRCAQLSPLVVHAIKFGGGYVAAAEGLSTPCCRTDVSATDLLAMVCGPSRSHAHFGASA
jgi:hypothetical protein